MKIERSTFPFVNSKLLLDVDKVDRQTLHNVVGVDGVTLDSDTGCYRKNYVFFYQVY